VNISTNGRYVVAAYADGTIRWHRADDGAELLAFFPHADRRNWVAWEPGGRFASSPGARGMLFWQINHGWDKTPTLVPAHQLTMSSRPEVIKRLLREGDLGQAILAAEEVQRKRELQRLVAGARAPGADLHVLSVGIDDYGAAARGLELSWAAKDAKDMFTALLAQTEDGWPFNRGHAVALLDEDAQKTRILTQIAEIGRKMALSPAKNDVAVLFFSGHGAVLGDGPTAGFHLLPHGVDWGPNETGRMISSISAAELQRAILGLAQHGRVLVLIDACRSGAAGLTLDAGAMRAALVGANVTVLTSSSGAQSSFERDDLKNGVFTEVLLEALGNAGDANGNGMIGVEEMIGYVAANVRNLTDGAQLPSQEMRFTGDLFAARH
jgi:hypothetical protein